MTITINILKSDLETTVGVGLPSKVFLEPSIPSLIYYTTDGSLPTNASSVYVSGISIPEGSVNFRIRAMATNGHDSSLITEWLFSTTTAHNFFAEGLTQKQANVSDLDYFPFGELNPDIIAKYYNNTSGTVYNEGNPNAFSNSFDADGNPTDFSNLPFIDDNYEIQYNKDEATSVYNEQGYSRMPDIFDFTNQNIQFQIVKKEAPQQGSDFKPGYDPKSHVTFQDCSLMNDLTPISYNTMNFTYMNVYEMRYSSQVFGTGAYEVQSPTMFFLNYFYNPTKNVLVFTYVDTKTQKWIFSEVPVTNSMMPPEELDSLAPFYSERKSRYVFDHYTQVLFPHRKS
jgi:hypothetical protein